MSSTKKKTVFDRETNPDGSIVIMKKCVSIMRRIYGRLQNDAEQKDVTKKYRMLYYDHMLEFYSLDRIYIIYRDYIRISFYMK